MVTGLLIALLAAAGAQRGGYDIDVPKGLRYEPEMSKTLATDLVDNRHYDGIAVDVGADAHVGDGIALYVLWAHATAPSDDPALAVRRTFDEIRAAPFATGDRIKAAEFVRWDEDVSDDLATATFEWMHRSNETHTLVRTAMWATADGMVRQVRAECVMHADAVDRTRKVCEAALASLSITAPRGPLGAVPSAGSIAVSDPADTSDDDSADGVRGAPPVRDDVPTMGPPQDGVIYRQAPEDAAERRDDAGNKLLYLGGGMLVLVALYMAARKLGTSDDATDKGEDSE